MTGFEHLLYSPNSLPTPKNLQPFSDIMTEAHLRIEALSFRHQIPAPTIRNPTKKRLGAGLHDISFDLPKGSITGLVGPNGAGKTTLLHLLSGLRSPDSGYIEIGNEKFRDLKKQDAGRDKVGLMPDTVRWQGNSTPKQVLHRLSLMNNGKVGDLLELVGLSSRSGETLDRLSTGMGQRLSLATALLGEPEILLLDEPFTGLDPVAQKALKQLTRELADRGTTILISSHLLNELESLVDRVILLHHGQVVIEGEIRAIKRNLKLDKILLLKGEKGDPLPLISEKVINSSINGNWSISVENEDGWSRKRLTKLVQKLSENGCIPYHVEVKTADLSDILEATTGIGGMDLSEHVMVPLSKREVEEE